MTHAPVDMSSAPLISIGMSIRNNAKTLAMSLRSILRQTCTDWELILIDDGSTDSSLAVADRFRDQRIRLVSKNRSCGLSCRLNQAIDLARGKYFARMDGDDVCFADRLAHQYQFLDDHPEVDLLGSGGIVFSGDGAPLGLRRTPTTHEDICRHPWSGFYLAHPSWMGRIEWFRRYRYDERAVKAQDYDLLLRTHRTSRFAALSEPLIGYREEELDLRKNIASRRQTAAAQWRYAREEGCWASLPMALAGQVAKGLVEVGVIGSGIERLALRHRAIPMDAEAKRRWQELWCELEDVPCAG